MPSDEIKNKLSEAKNLLREVIYLTKSEDVKAEALTAIDHIDQAEEEIVDLFEIG